MTLTAATAKQSTSVNKGSSKLRPDEHKRSVKNCDCNKNGIVRHCLEADLNFSWYQKKFVNLFLEFYCFRSYARHNHFVPADPIIIYIFHHIKNEVIH